MGAPVPMEPLLKYWPSVIWFLTGKSPDTAWRVV